MADEGEEDDEKEDEDRDQRQRNLCLFVGINGAGRLLQVRRSMNRRMEYGGVQEPDA